MCTQKLLPLILIALMAFVPACKSGQVNAYSSGVATTAPIITTADPANLQRQLKSVEDKNAKYEAAAKYAARAKAERERLGISKLCVGVIPAFSDYGASAISPEGVAKTIDQMKSWSYGSFVSGPRHYLTELIPSMSSDGYLNEEVFSSLRDGLRDPQILDMLWSQKEVVLQVLDNSGRRQEVARLASKLLPYYEGKIDQTFNRLCKKYYDKHKDDWGFDYSSPEMKAVMAKYELAALQNWLFVQRNRDAGGELLIQTQRRILRDLASPA